MDKNKGVVQETENNPGEFEVLKEPLDLLMINLDEKIIVKMKNDRELKGILHGFDQHLNLVLGDVEETITVVEVDDETYEEMYKTTRRTIPLLYVRGDGVTLIAPPTREFNKLKNVKK